MNKKPENLSNVGSTEPKQPSKPNEAGSFSIEAFVKIFDPESKEIFLEKRA